MTSASYNSSEEVIDSVCTKINSGSLFLLFSPPLLLFLPPLLCFFQLSQSFFESGDHLPRLLLSSKKIKIQTIMRPILLHPKCRIIMNTTPQYPSYTPGDPIMISTQSTTVLNLSNHGSGARIGSTNTSYELGYTVQEMVPCCPSLLLVGEMLWNVTRRCDLSDD